MKRSVSLTSVFVSIRNKTSLRVHKLLQVMSLPLSNVPTVSVTSLYVVQLVSGHGKCLTPLSQPNTTRPTWDVPSHPKSQTTTRHFPSLPDLTTFSFHYSRFRPEGSFFVVGDLREGPKFSSIPCWIVCDLLGGSMDRSPSWLKSSWRTEVFGNRKFV